MGNLFLEDGKTLLINIANNEHDYLHPYKVEVYNSGSDTKYSENSVTVEKDGYGGLTASSSREKIKREESVRSELSINLWAISEVNHHEYKINIYSHKGQIYVEAEDQGQREYRKNNEVYLNK